ncbi:hypothetical protein L218DRAFT_989632 [Marasmius fiardii PR-910]|nr:hypothetical protein L218DRAFT_989632 [Marasmius fiardii PR-910]
MVFHLSVFRQRGKRRIGLCAMMLGMAGGLFSSVSAMAGKSHAMTVSFGVASGICAFVGSIITYWERLSGHSSARHPERMSRDSFELTVMRTAVPSLPTRRTLSMSGAKSFGDIVPSRVRVELFEPKVCKGSRPDSWVIDDRHDTDREGLTLVLPKSPSSTGATFGGRERGGHVVQVSSSPTTAERPSWSTIFASTPYDVHNDWPEKALPGKKMWRDSMIARKVRRMWLLLQLPFKKAPVVIHSAFPSHRFEIDASNQSVRTNSTLENYRKGGFRYAGSHTMSMDPGGAETDIWSDFHSTVNGSIAVISESAGSSVPSASNLKTQGSFTGSSVSIHGGSFSTVTGHPTSLDAFSRGPQAQMGHGGYRSYLNDYCQGTWEASPRYTDDVRGLYRWHSSVYAHGLEDSQG